MAVEDVLRRARVLADLGRFDAADALLAQVLAGEPDHEEALALLGHGLVMRKRFAEAEDMTKRLLRVNPDNLQGLLRMALVQRALRRPREGVPFVRRAVELHPDTPACLHNLAEALNEVTHGSAEALGLAERAVGIDPDYVPAHWLIGKIHLDVGQFAEAERATLQALRVDPAHAPSVLQLGLARAGLGRFGESREQVAAALRLRATPEAINEVINSIECRGIPGHFAQLYGMALAARGQPDLSRPGAAGTDPELLAAQAKLAYRMCTWEAGPDGLRRAGELADAVLAADAGAGNPDARYVRSLMLSQARQYQQALRIAEQLLAEGYRHVPLALLRARGGLCDFAGALAAVRLVLADNPDRVLYLIAESMCLRQLGRHDEALRSAQRAARLVPAGRGVQLELGLAAKGAGDIVLAERALRAAVAAAPDEGEPVGELALLLAEADRWPETESLIAAVPADVRDAPDVSATCAKIATLAITRAQPFLSQVDGIDDPDAEALAASAHWLDVALRMWTAMASFRADSAKVLISKGLPRAVDVLHKVAAPPGSGFARVVRDFDALLESWRSP